MVKPFLNDELSLVTDPDQDTTGAMNMAYWLLIVAAALVVG